MNGPASSALLSCERWGLAPFTIISPPARPRRARALAAHRRRRWRGLRRPDPRLRPGRGRPGRRRGFDAKGCAAARGAGSAAVELVAGRAVARRRARDAGGDRGASSAGSRPPPCTPPRWPPTPCIARSAWPPATARPRCPRPAPHARGDERRSRQRGRGPARARRRARRAGRDAGAVVRSRHRRRAELLLAAGRDRRSRPGPRHGHPAHHARPARALPRGRRGRLPGRIRERLDAQPLRALQRPRALRRHARAGRQAGRRQARHRPLRAHRRRRRGPARARGRGSGQGPELRARPADRRRARPPQLPARGAGEAARARAGARRPGCRWPTSARARTCASSRERAGRSSCAGTATAPAAEGEIVDREGRVLGRHGGHHRFTVGQRRGIGVAAPEPLYVLAKDARRNRVVVGRAGRAGHAHAWRPRRRCCTAAVARRIGAAALRGRGIPCSVAGRAASACGSTFSARWRRRPRARPPA